jgi:hypothetical protein
VPAHAQTSATTPGASRIYSTIYSIGVEWDIAGDANHTAAASVAYRVHGTPGWSSALPLVRVDFNGANMLAGSLLFLTPGTAYDVAITLSDPDGGAETRTLTSTTRALPVLAAGGRTLHVTTGSGGGDGSSTNPFRGVATAQAAAQPGDVLLLHAGSYGGRIRFDKPGTASSYIAWRAYGDGEVLMNGVDIAASHIWLEGLTIRNQSYATFSIGAPDDVVLKRCFFYNNHYSIYLQQGGTNWYIADNTVVGDTAYTTESFDGEGIELNQTSGHTVAHNSITNVADGISYPLMNVDIFGNDIFDTSDDGIEADYGYANIRMWGNRIHNATHNGISFQPQNGGPWFILRNQIVQNVESPFKFRTTDRFVLLHNTIVNWGTAWPSDAMMCCNEEHLMRSFSRNNLWIAVQGGQIWGFDSFTRDWRTDLDYDGFDWGTAPNPFTYGGVAYADLPSLSAASGLEGSGIRVAKGSCFVTFNVPTAPPSPVPPQVMTLRPDCNAVDAGQVLPGINDDFAGAAPDLGAYESGLPTPVFGPRSAPSARLQLSAAHIAPGAQATLSWTTTDATAVTIDALGGVSATGYALVSPAQTTTFVLTATGQSGVATATATLVVDGTGTQAAPAAPTTLTAAATSTNTVHLLWTDGSDNETGFTVERSTDGVTFVDAGSAPINALALDVTGLSPSTTYVFRVRAFNAAGVSPYSPTATATTPQVPLGVPTSLTAAALNRSQIRLAWRDNSSAETGFRIERSTNNKSFSVVATAAAGVTTFTDSGLRGGATYYYRVFAVNAGGSSAASNVASAATPKK